MKCHMCMYVPVLACIWLYRAVCLVTLVWYCSSSLQCRWAAFMMMCALSLEADWWLA